MADIDTLAAALRDRAPALRGLGYRVRIELTEGGGALLLDGTTQPVSVALVAADEDTGEERAADCTLRLSASDMERLMAGRLSPMLAFSTGRLRVEGSKGVAMKLAGLLDAE